MVELMQPPRAKGGCVSCGILRDPSGPKRKKVGGIVGGVHGRAAKPPRRSAKLPIQAHQCDAQAAVRSLRRPELVEIVPGVMLMWPGAQ